MKGSGLQTNWCKQDMISARSSADLQWGYIHCCIHCKSSSRYMISTRTNKKHLAPTPTKIHKCRQTNTCKLYARVLPHDHMCFIVWTSIRMAHKTAPRSKLHGMYKLPGPMPKTVLSHWNATQLRRLRWAGMATLAALDEPLLLPPLPNCCPRFSNTFLARAWTSGGWSWTNRSKNFWASISTQQATTSWKSPSLKFISFTWFSICWIQAWVKWASSAPCISPKIWGIVVSAGAGCNTKWSVSLTISCNEFALTCVVVHDPCCMLAGDSWRGTACNQSDFEQHCGQWKHAEPCRTPSLRMLLRCLCSVP